MKDLELVTTEKDCEINDMERDIAYFVSWCIEEYKTVAGLGGSATMELLDKYGILQYLADNFEVLHTQSRQWLMEEIGEQLEQRKNLVQG